MMDFEQFVDKYADYLLKLASMYSKDEQLTEEIVQASINRYERLKLEENEEEARRALAAMTVKTAKAYVKYKQKGVFSNKKTPLETYNENKDGTLIDALYRLKPEERALLFFYYYDEMSFREISETLNIPVQIIQKKLPKVQKKYQTKLRNDEIESSYETMFRRQFDKEYGSTYAARRRIKQHLYQEEKEIKVKVKDKQPPKVFSVSIIVALIFALTISIPFQFHRHNILPHFNKEIYEWNLYMYSMLSWNDNFGEFKKNLFDSSLYDAAFNQYIEEQGIEIPDNVLYEERYDEMVQQYKVSFLYDSTMEAIWNGMKDEFNIDEDYYINHYVDSFLSQMLLYEILTPKQLEEIDDYNLTFLEEHEESINRLKKKFKITDTLETELKPLPKNVEFAFGNTYVNNFAVLEDDTIVYKYLYTIEGTLTDNYIFYISELEKELDLAFIPLHYKSFYEYITKEVEEGSVSAKSLAQLLQILSNTYDQAFPGWIDPVPPLKLEDIEVNLE